MMPIQSFIGPLFQSLWMPNEGATNTPSALSRLAHQTGVDSWDLEDMAHGTKPVSAAVLRYFELTRQGRAYVGRVR